MPAFTKSLLVIGGARSGKSRHAQAMAEAAATEGAATEGAATEGAATGGGLIFIATAQAFDQEMTERIARHRADRDARWRTLEAPLALAETIAAADRPGATLLVDCLTLWASNMLLADADYDAAAATLVATLERTQARIVLVSNEVGCGIVPDNALARRFRDVAGWLNQRVAAAVSEVDCVIAGLPQRLKG